MILNQIILYNRRMNSTPTIKTSWCSYNESFHIMLVNVMDFIESKINFIKNNHISCFIFNDMGKVLRLKDPLKWNK